MAMFWTLIFVIWKTNEITWIMEGMEGYKYALPGSAFVALGLQARVSQRRLYFEDKNRIKKIEITGGIEHE